MWRNKFRKNVENAFIRRKYFSSIGKLLCVCVCVIFGVEINQLWVFASFAENCWDYSSKWSFIWNEIQCFLLNFIRRIKIFMVKNTQILSTNYFNELKNACTKHYSLSAESKEKKNKRENGEAASITLTRPFLFIK